MILLKKLLPFFFVFLLSCSTTNKFSENYQIQCDNTSSDAVFSTLISYQSSSSITQVENVKLDAIDGVLFRGLAGGNNCIAQKPMLIENRSDVSKTDFYNKLYGKSKAYNKYIIDINIVSNDIKIKPDYTHTFKVIINKELLRKDLITAGLLKPLSSGF